LQKDYAEQRLFHGFPFLSQWENRFTIAKRIILPALNESSSIISESSTKPRRYQKPFRGILVPIMAEKKIGETAHNQLSQYAEAVRTSRFAPALFRMSEKFRFNHIFSAWRRFFTKN
jgi:hypothetical protein